MRKFRKGINLEARIKSLELTRRWLVLCGGLLSLFGLSLGGMLYNGYCLLKEREAELRSDFSRVTMEYISATNDLAAVRAESQSTAMTVAKKCEELTGLCSEIVRKAETANELVEEIGSDCRLAQDMIRNLDEYVAKSLKTPPQRFTVDVSGIMAKCTLVDGVGVPYSRTVAGKRANALVVVPSGCVCVVRLSGKMCRIRIQSKIRDRVIVENGGKMGKVEYFD